MNSSKPTTSRYPVNLRISLEKANNSSTHIQLNPGERRPSTSLSVPVTPTEPQRHLSKSLSIHSASPYRRNNVPEGINTWSPDRVAEILENTPPSEVLLLDLRSFTQYSENRIRNAISVCIPSTLLKRPTFGFDRMLEFLPSDVVPLMADLDHVKYIIVYDSKTRSLESCGPIPLFCTYQKLHSHLYSKNARSNCQLGFLAGGMHALLESHPSLAVMSRLSEEESSYRRSKCAFNLSPVTTGHNVPNNWRMYTPTLNNQDDTCQLRSAPFMNQHISKFPGWIRNILQHSDQGHSVLSENFKQLQIHEQARIQQALSRDSRARSSGNSALAPEPPSLLFPPGVSSASPISSSSSSPTNRVTPLSCVQTQKEVVNDNVEFSFFTGDDVTKNRYANIAPYNHTRVVLSASCDKPDYINASYIKTSFSNLNYIATQAPLPNSCDDFWKAAWDHKVPLIVKLEALAPEDVTSATHAYWVTGRYGEIKVTEVEESQYEKISGVVLRRITLRNVLTETTRSLTQIAFRHWPDLGIPDQLGHLLDLVALKAELLEEYSTSVDHSDYVLVHCSAGCGRTGTFITVDSVIDHMKRYSLEYHVNNKVDIIYETVHELRSQRLAMVQVQRQFNICYDTVMVWYSRAYNIESEGSSLTLPECLRPPGSPVQDCANGKQVP